MSPSNAATWTSSGTYQFRQVAREPENPTTKTLAEVDAFCERIIDVARRRPAGPLLAGAVGTITPKLNCHRTSSW
jgi:hypothetical protein